MGALSTAERAAQSAPRLPDPAVVPRHRQRDPPQPHGDQGAWGRTGWGKGGARLSTAGLGWVGLGGGGGGGEGWDTTVPGCGGGGWVGR